MAAIFTDGTAAGPCVPVGPIEVVARVESRSFTSDNTAGSAPEIIAAVAAAASGRNVGDPRSIVQVLGRVTGPVTIIAGEQVARDDARAELASLRADLRARVACVPHAKDAAGTTGFGSSSALGVTGVMGISGP